jgi:hypothetical protein
LKKIFQTICASLAAALLGGLAAACVSCGTPRGGAGVVGVPDSLAASPSADTLALVEGLRLFDLGEYDLARESLAVSARSGSSYIRAESFLYLNALEMELGNYRAARTHLDRYHAETMRLLRAAADSQSRSERRTARLVGRYEALVGWMSLVLAVLVGGALLIVRRRVAWTVRGSRKPTPGPEADDARNAARYGADGGARDGALNGGPNVAPEPAREPAGPIPAECALWLAEAETFKGTDMWAEVSALAAQRPGRDAQVLTIARQDALDGELAAVFRAFAADLPVACPSLTAGDVKFMCLSLAGLSAFGRALCFGSTETNIVKQRKYTIKKKLAADAHTRALFEFVFGVNRRV